MQTQGLNKGALLRHETYRIEKILGQGGFGITYLATDLSLDRLVAIKEFFPKDYCERDHDTSHLSIGTSGSSDFVSRLKAKFLKEARNIAKFDHPGIIKIHAAFEENNTAYYVMDYIEGESLSDKIKREGPLSEEAALNYITKAGEALAYIHQQKMNHLDVKPANIMIRKADDFPILIDFGLSKQYDSEGNQTSTTPVGISHGFAPLEQYNDGGVKEFSPQTDIYSLAATLYYLVSGVTPPHATQLIEEEISFPTGFPANLISAISIAMSSARKHRYSDVSYFLAALKPTDEATDIAAPPVVSVPPSTSEPIKPIEQTPTVSKTEERPEPNLIKWLMLIGTIAIVGFLATTFIQPDEQMNEIIISKEEQELAQKYHWDKYGICQDQIVDLGLSVKWAGWNVGASSPDQNGKLFGWGDPTGNEISTDQSKYPIEEPPMSICGDTRYDMATVNWGRPWRLPTKKEFDELIKECKWEPFTYKGVRGKKVMGPNGNTIFLPYTNRRKRVWDEQRKIYHPNGFKTVDNSGYYYSGELKKTWETMFGRPYYLVLSYGSVMWSEGVRSDGLVVRAVYAQ